MIGKEQLKINYKEEIGRIYFEYTLKNLIARNKNMIFYISKYKISKYYVVFEENNKFDYSHNNHNEQFKPVLE